jgi:hypothetical protein
MGDQNPDKNAIAPLVLEWIIRDYFPRLNGARWMLSEVSFS